MNGLDITSYFRLSLPWGGRPVVATGGSVAMDFNPRPPWGGRRLTDSISSSRSNFNPRPPWGGRHGLSSPHIAEQLFQSTPSVGRATSLRAERRLQQNISIHALRGEGDGECPFYKTTRKSFQSTPSVGRATPAQLIEFAPDLFQSTPSVGRATGDSSKKINGRGISIHALRGEGDRVRSTHSR